MKISNLLAYRSCRKRKNDSGWGTPGAVFSKLGGNLAPEGGSSGGGAVLGIGECPWGKGRGLVASDGTPGSGDVVFDGATYLFSGIHGAFSDVANGISSCSDSAASSVAYRASSVARSKSEAGYGKGGDSNEFHNRCSNQWQLFQTIGLKDRWQPRMVTQK